MAYNSINVAAGIRHVEPVRREQWCDGVMLSIHLYRGWNNL